MPVIKLKSLKFQKPPFRKLGDIEILFAERITVIAGHNGIGKSTILGLVSNGSGLSDTDHISYLNKTFQANLNEIVHLDYEKEYEEYKTKNLPLPSPCIHYEIDDVDLVKKCSITSRTDSKRIRVVPRNDPHKSMSSPDGSIEIGPDAKVPLPTIYLGMTRMLPVGESNPAWVNSSIDKSINELDATFIQSFISGVIGTGSPAAGPKTITNQSIKGTGKTAKHPAYAYNAKCVSLGQDSLSAIATALASFKKLKRDWDGYPGGLFVIDEIDAGFHPHAQERLMKAIAAAARDLNLQVIATTHSIRLIEAIHPDSQKKGVKAKHVDSVVYLTDTQAPRVAENYSLADIQHDMNLTIAPKVKKTLPKKLKIYLEDPQAHYFLTKLLTQKLKLRVKKEAGVGLNPIPLSAGCENLKGFVKHDSYFSTVLIALDADASLAGLGVKGKNIVKLPGGKKPGGQGLSPEATIYRFIEKLEIASADFPTARAALKAQKVTSNFLREHLLNGDTDITKRESAKSWMKAKLDVIDQWCLVDLWIKEHPVEVSVFEDKFVTAAVATAKVQ